MPKTKDIQNILPLKMRNLLIPFIGSTLLAFIFLIAATKLRYSVVFFPFSFEWILLIIITTACWFRIKVKLVIKILMIILSIVLSYYLFLFAIANIYQHSGKICHQAMQEKYGADYDRIVLANDFSKFYLDRSACQNKLFPFPWLGKPEV